MASLYAAAFAVILAVAAVMIDASLFVREIGHPVNVWGYVRLAWLCQLAVHRTRGHPTQQVSAGG